MSLMSVFRSSSPLPFLPPHSFLLIQASVSSPSPFPSSSVPHPHLYVCLPFPHHNSFSPFFLFFLSLSSPSFTLFSSSPSIFSFSIYTSTSVYAFSFPSFFPHLILPHVFLLSFIFPYTEFTLSRICSPMADGSLTVTFSHDLTAGLPMWR